MNNQTVTLDKYQSMPEQATTNEIRQHPQLNKNIRVVTFSNETEIDNNSIINEDADDVG